MACEAFCGLGISGGSDEKIRDAHGNRPFYTYYQISREDQSDEAEAEPKNEGELRTRHENSHSPFGFLWQVATATGWTVEYILKKINYQTLIMMLSDAPRDIEVRVGTKQSKTTEEEEANEIAGFFRSNLSK